MERLPQDQTASECNALAAALSSCEMPLPRVDAVASSAANDTHMQQLARTIQQEIIPRLMLAHRIAPLDDATCADAIEPICQADIDHMTKLVLAPDDDSSLALVQSHLARGVPIETIYLDLLAPTARYLGVLWEEDLCSFSEVTIGLCRLQRVLRELSPSFGGSGVAAAPSSRRILLAPSPGEQHTFGLVMVAEFFRRAGWDVTGGAWFATRDVAALVSAESFDVIGFSLSAEVHVQALADCIAAVRHATCNPALSVIVGGPMFLLHPEFLDRVGADGMTIDGSEAPALAERLVLQNALRHVRTGR